MTVFWILLVALVLAGLQALVLGRFALNGLSYERHFSQTSAYEGETVELVEVLKNRKLLPVPWLRVESRISPHLRFQNAQGGEREINEDQYHKSVFALGPFSQVVRRHRVVCLKRGYYDVGSLAMTAGDLFAAHVSSRQMRVACALTVYPRLLPEDDPSLPSARWQGELTVRRYILPDPFLVGGIREYRAGDGLRDIHWAATARTGQLQVKVHDFSADPKLLVVLNVQASEDQWGELMDYEQPPIEQGIRIAATTCLRALAGGVEAGFAANASLVGAEGRCVRLAPARASGQAEGLLTALARLRIHREVSFPTFLEELKGLTGADILILSMYDSPLLEERREQLRRMGNNVVMRLLERGAQTSRGGAADEAVG